MNSLLIAIGVVGVGFAWGGWHIAKEKNRSPGTGAALRFFGWFFGLILLACLPSYEDLTNRRGCPHCMETMRCEASVCPHCQRPSAAWEFRDGYWWDRGQYLDKNHQWQEASAPSRFR